eukprot:jgi/Psemu1/323610/estExt_fgenesh1_pg.C_820020
MMEPPTEVPILLFYSSCSGFEEAADFTDAQADAGSSSGSDGGQINLALELAAAQPIFCDLLLLPEFGSPETSFPQDDSSSGPAVENEHLYFPETTLNPCGVSNVLSLENLPEPWKEGSVLLSLTSCSIRYSESDEGSSPIRALPVEPSPSTFANVTTGKFLAEILVNFDLLEASLQIHEFLLYNQNNHEDSSVTVEGDEEQDIQLPEGELKNSTQCRPQQHNDNVLGEDNRRRNSLDLKFCSDIEARNDDEDKLSYGDNLAPEESVFRNDHLRASFANLHYQEQKRLLAEMNSRMLHETQTMDLILRMCSFVFVFLILILAWAIYQYYRSATQTDAFSQELRSSLTTTRGVLREAVDGLYRHHDLQQQQKQGIAIEVPGELKSIRTTHNSIVTKMDASDADSIRRDTESDHTRANADDLLGSLEEQQSCKSISTTSPIPHSVITGILSEDASSSDVQTEEYNKHENVENGKKRVASLQDHKTLNTCARTNRDEDKIKSPTDSYDTKVEKNSKDAIPFTPIQNVIDSNIDSVQEVSSFEDDSSSSENEEKHIEEKIKTSVDAEVQLDPRSTPMRVPFLDLPTSPQLEEEKEFSFLGKFPRRSQSFCRTSDLDKATRSIPPSLELTNDWSQDKSICRRNGSRTIGSPLSSSLKSAEGQKGGMTISSKKITTTTKTPAPLSPCSQLAKDWNEGKTVRRSNLTTKRRPRLKPVLSHPNPAICNDDGGKIMFESTILSLVPQNSKLRSRYQQHQETQQQSFDIPGPPRLRSVAARNDVLVIGNDNEVTESSFSSSSLDEDETAALKYDTEKERKSLNGMNTPPPSSSTEKTPHLCYTPASEDDSFIADYW